MGATVLCVDTECAKNPALLGLADENLAAQDWLDVVCDAVEARKALRERSDWHQAWVFSSDSMDGLNLAAAIKRDSPACEVLFCAAQRSGSALSRCEAAGVKALFGAQAFLRCYESAKRKALDELEPNEEDMAALEAACDEGTDKRRTAPLQPTMALPVVAASSSVVPKRATSKAAEKSSAAPTRAIVKVRAGADAGKPFVLAVVSGSGGTGKSAVSAVAALLLAARGKSVALLDADFQFGDLHHLVGDVASVDVLDLLEHPERISALGVQEGVPCLIKAPERLEQSEVASPRLGELVDLLARRFDAVVVNTGSFWSDSHAQLLERADKTLFLMDQRPSSIRSCAHALELCARCGIAIQPFVFALNFSSRNASITTIDAACALKGVNVKELRDGGPEVSELLGAGLASSLLGEGNAFVASMDRLLRGICPDYQGADRAGGRETKKRRGSLFGLGRRRAACL